MRVLRFALLCPAWIALFSTAQPIPDRGGNSVERVSMFPVSGAAAPQASDSLPPRIRMVYLVPADRAPDPRYPAAMERAIRSLQIFYRNQMGNGVSFLLHAPVVETYHTSHPVSWYQTNPSGFWADVLADAFPLTGGGFNDPLNRWIYYIDADPVCNQPGGAGTGGTSGVALLPANDLRGLVGEASVPICPGDLPWPAGGTCRWIGGLGHELGHALLLPHPPGCDQPQPGVTCPSGALMWTGYATYPNATLLPADKTALTSGGFFQPLELQTVLPPCDCPLIAEGGIVNLASYVGAGVAPGQLVSIFGSFFGPAQLAGTQFDQRGIVSTMGATRVFFDDLPAPVLSSVSGQVNVAVPYGVALRSSTVVHLEYEGRRSFDVPVPVVAANPGVFTANSSGTGQAAALNEDFTINSADHPAERGHIVVLYATGEGQTSPPGIDGLVLSTPAPQPRLPVQVLIGGQTARILYAGGAPGLVSGVMQINAAVPEMVIPGNAVPVEIMVGEFRSQSKVTLAIR